MYHPSQRVCDFMRGLSYAMFCFVLQDLIGKALPTIGAYNSLDNSRQVVALINDVSHHVFWKCSSLT